MTVTVAAKVSPSRLAAFTILAKIGKDQGNCDELLHSRAVDALAPADRNLCTNLVMGVLRWQIALDAVIKGALARPEARLSGEVEIALRLGVYQLRYLDRVPAHAAISESVELAKRSGNRYAAGMVNAVLRRIAAAPPRPSRNLESARDVAAAYAHPEWMVERWAKRYGLGIAARICAFDQEPPAAHIRLTDEAALAQLAQEGVELADAAFLTRARRVVRGNVTETVAYKSGLVRIQDEGSQLVAELAGKGSRILDCCAAPGGKTAILAERSPDAEITACDVSQRRLQQMKAAWRSLAGKAQLQFVLADATKLSFAAEFDLVLCDVPCSGTGTMARNPEIRHRLEPRDLARHHERQAAILLSAMNVVERGGRLLYSTCSLEPEENEQVIAECLKQRAGFRLRPLETELERLVESGAATVEGAATLRATAFENGCLRTIPGIHPCDGFFAAMLQRVE